MRWFSYVAVYVLFWVLSAFAVMPWGIRSHVDDESVQRTAGQERGAPVNFRPGRIALRTTVVSLILFALFFANLRYGWIRASIVQDIVPMPERLRNSTLWQ